MAATLDNPCKVCPDPALCARLGRHIVGRLWDIWRGVNIDEATARQYRGLWLDAAGLPDEARRARKPRVSIEAQAAKKRH